jgi:hypothetical protein
MPTGESLRRELEARTGRKIQFPEFKFGQAAASSGSGVSHSAEQAIEKEKARKVDGGARLAPTSNLSDKKTL